VKAKTRTSKAALEQSSSSTALHKHNLPIETLDLAKALIGWRLVRHARDGTAGGRIVETEAYLVGDPASHAYRGRRPRNLAMYGLPFHAYVYHIYGMYWCFNVTSEEHGTGAGILVRALEPDEGIDLMRARRGVEALRLLCSGPGRLAQALEIDRSLDGRDLFGDPEIALLPPQRPPGKIGRSRRIGISLARHRLLRFYERGSPYVSGPKALSP
jgi:DNA-3-methyladenine glycosylase